MGILDNYRNIVKIQLAGTTAGTTKLGWIESAVSFFAYGLLTALAFAHGWWVSAVILLGLIVAMAIIGFGK